MYWESVLYNGEIEAFECGFPCFLPEYDAVFHAQKIAKKDCPFLLFSPNFGRVTRLMNPISLPSTPLFRCPETRFLIPQTTFWGIPFCHLGYPISPFGMSHFTFWGILRRVYAPILAPFYPLFALISSHFRGKKGRQNVCLSPQLSGNQIPSHQITVNLSPKQLIHI